MKISARINNLLFIVLVFFSLNCNSQEYKKFYYQMNLANLLAKEQKIDSALTVYESAFKKVNYVNTDFLEKALGLAKTSKDDKRVLKYLAKIENQLKGTSPELIRIVDSLFTEDQRIRQRKYSKASKYYWKCVDNSKYSKESRKFKKAEVLQKEWERTDSSNAITLLNLIDKFGYVGEELIGRNYYKANTIFLHFDNDSNNVILQPILDEAIKDGRISPRMYATILDRHSFFIQNEQIYWVWPCTSKKNKLPFSESDKKRIYQLRESIGIYGSKFWQEQKKNYWILRNEY